MLAAMTSQPPEFATVTADDVVTGEAVALDVPPASLGPRMVSGSIDLVTTFLLLLLALWLATLASLDADEALLTVAMIGTFVAVLIGIPTAVETITRGKSLGKLIVGLRTVRDDGGPVSFQHAFVRALIGIVEIFVLTGVPAFFSALLSHKGKRLGDYAAGTYVVRDRVRLRLPTPPAMPPHLALWARNADITSLPVGLTLAVRQFLARAATLDPESRQRVGLDLARRVSAHVAPPPPPGVVPEHFLAAVVASRRERDAERLRREDDLRRRLLRR